MAVGVGLRGAFTRSSEVHRGAAGTMAPCCFLRNEAMFSTSFRAMYIRTTGIWALVCSVFVVGTGCKKSDANAPQSEATDNSPVATVHWMGAARLTKEANATGFLKIWRLPETDRLRAQTLDKLAIAPWLLSSTNRPPATTNYATLVRENHSASLIRPLLDDLVQNECYLEVREAKPASAQVALAVRLDSKRAGFWETNLGAVFAAVSGSHASTAQSAARAWEIQSVNSAHEALALLRHVELTRTGDWTVLGFSPGQNEVFADLLGRIQHNQMPSATPSTNNWLEAIFDLRRLSSALAWSWDLPLNWPLISLAINGDGANVQTRGQLHFRKPLPFEIEPWNIPTNLIHEPLHSFTAIQGIKPWLSSIKWWEDLHAPATPNQVFFWAQTGLPFVDYAAAPLTDASTTMAKLGPGIVNSMNPLLSSNRMGKWERATNSDGVVWTKVPIITPFVHSVRLDQGQFLFGGLSSLVVTSTPPPAGTLQALLSQPQTVYFDREITGPRIDAWMYVGQLFRLIFRHEQLPAEASSVAWLKAAGPMLETSSTLVTKTTSTDLSLSRTSTVGLTGNELHLLADWLESPLFPFGVYSTLMKLPPLRSHRPGAVSPTGH
jgi:hypothetical protein